MKNTFYIVLFTACLFLLASYNQQKTEWKGVIEEKDGVTAISNLQEPIYEQDVFYLEDELIIDLESDDLSSLGIGKVEDFVVDTEGNIYLSYRCQIYKFDSDGRFVLTLNQFGQGPGEF